MKLSCGLYYIKHTSGSGFFLLSSSSVQVTLISGLVFNGIRVFILYDSKDFVETCRSVDKNICHECGLYALNKVPGQGYNLSHQSPHGNVAIALKLDCSYRNLSELPEVPPQTWQLNISGNSIKDLVPLKQPMYENLLILDADSNEISTLEGLAGTAFLDRYNYLSLQSNRISVVRNHLKTFILTCKISTSL